MFSLFTGQYFHYELVWYQLCNLGALDKNILSRFRSITQNCPSQKDKKVLFLQRDFHLELKNYVG